MLRYLLLYPWAGLCCIPPKCPVFLRPAELLLYLQSELPPHMLVDLVCVYLFVDIWRVFIYGQLGASVSLVVAAAACTFV